MKKRKVFVDIIPWASESDWLQTNLKGESESFHELRNVHNVCSANPPHHLNLLVWKRWVKARVSICGIEIYKGRELCSSNGVLVCFLDPLEKWLSGEERERLQTYTKRSWWAILSFSVLVLNCAYALRCPSGARFIAFQDWNLCREQGFVKKYSKSGKSCCSLVLYSYFCLGSL